MLQLCIAGRTVFQSVQEDPSEKSEWKQEESALSWIRLNGGIYHSIFAGVGGIIIIRSPVWTHKNPTPSQYIQYLPANLNPLLTIFAFLL